MWGPPLRQVLVERGERAKAKWQYEKILGSALLGHSRAEHWAHSEYAWIAFEDGDLSVPPGALPPSAPPAAPPPSAPLESTCARL